MRLSVVVGALGVAIACTPSRSSSSRGQDSADITQATYDWVAAFETGDVAQVMTFLTADAVLIPPNEPELAGTAAIEAWSQRMFAAVTIQEASVTIDDVRVADDWAVSHGVWRMTMAAGDAIVGDTTRYVLIWERQADGTWKIAHDVWNSARPAAPGG